MDYSSVLLSLIKEENIRKHINPVTYYALKLVYNPSFKKRSRYFSSALKQFFETLGNTLDISLFDESMIMQNKNNDKTIMNDTICIDLNLNGNMDNNNLNITLNKDCYMNMSNVFSHNSDWSVKMLFESDEVYILDREDDYVLLNMVKNYLFSDEDPKSSQLLIAYNIFATSVELIYCLKLVENFPKSIYNPRELARFRDYTESVKYRIRLFYGSWIKLYRDKYEKNPLIKEMIGNEVMGLNDESSVLDLISLSMGEPLLNSKYISFTKLIREGPFCFDIEEVARQICIIDHEYMSTLKIGDYNKFVIQRELPSTFEKFSIREKQIKCYILLFILMHNNLENKKNMVQSFISLAHTCKELQNQQTSYTIISAFNIVGLSRKKLLWKLVEKKYREIFSNLEKDFNDFEMNEAYSLEAKNVTFPMVPHINRVKNNVNNFIINMKHADSDSLMKLSRDYKDFYLLMEELAKNKYSFFKVNPIYDFFQFGFLEIFKPKKWNLKLRIDFSQFTNDMNQLDQLLEFLITNFKKLDS